MIGIIIKIAPAQLSDSHFLAACNLNSLRLVLWSGCSPLLSQRFEIDGKKKNGIRVERMEEQYVFILYAFSSASCCPCRCVYSVFSPSS